MASSPKQTQYFVLSHKGMVRANNEDKAVVESLGDNNGNKIHIAVLADGVGGHTAGEVASRIAVNTIINELRGSRFFDPHSALDDAIEKANQAILDDIAQHPIRKGMGTTCVCALILGNTLYPAHLGDSRLYLLRGKSLSQLTRDHTMLEEYRHLTIVHPDNITRSHPLAHVLSRYLGSADPIDIDHELTGVGQGARTLELLPGDVLLLCSDGLTDLLSEKEIAHILLTCSGRKRTQTLVMRALEKGGHDNTTVIVLDIP